LIKNFVLIDLCFLMSIQALLHPYLYTSNRARPKPSKS